MEKDIVMGKGDIKAKVKFLNLKGQLDAGVKKEMARILARSLPRVAIGIKTRLKIVVRDLIHDSRAYGSIYAGTLRAELGIPDPFSIESIIETWVNNIEVSVIGDTIKIGILEEDYSDVLLLAEASYSTEKGVVIEWLKWLLTEGAKTLVFDYVFRDNRPRNSRTGTGIMVKKVGKSWQVPSEFRSIGDNNFATRALESLELLLDDIVRQEATKGIR